jgi:hypothetical protein
MLLRIYTYAHDADRAEQRGGSRRGIPGAWFCFAAQVDRAAPCVGARAHGNGDGPGGGGRRRRRALQGQARVGAARAFTYGS